MSDYVSNETVAIDIIRAANLGIWQWNVQTGKLTVNERWAQIIGYTLEELGVLTIDTWLAFVYREDISFFEEAAKKILTGAMDSFSTPCRMLHKEGHLVWVLSQCRLIKRTENGKPLLMAGTHRDVTSDQIVQDELQKTTEELNRFFSVKADLFCSFDRDGKILKTNKSFQNYLGYVESDLENRLFIEFLHSDDWIPSLDFFRDLLLNKNKDASKRLVNRFRNKQGSYVYIEWYFEFVANTLYAVGRDISILTEREKKFKAVFSATPLPFLIHDPDTGEVVEANQKALDVYKAKNVTELFHTSKWSEPPYSPQDALAFIQRACKEGPIDFEWKGLSNGNVTVWEHIYLCPIVIEDKQRVLSIPIDITRLKETEKESQYINENLAYANQLQRTLLDISAILLKADLNNLHDCVVEASEILGTNIQTDIVFTILYQPNTEKAELEAYWKKPSLSPKTTQVFPAIFHDGFKKFMQHYQHGEPISISCDKDCPDAFIAKKMHDFNIRSVLLVPLYAHELFYGFIATATYTKDKIFTPEETHLAGDIANLLTSTIHRISAMEKISKSEEVFKTTLISIGDGVICTDKNTTITFINQVAEKLTGYTRDEAIGLPFDTVFKLHNGLTNEIITGIAEKVIIEGKGFSLANHSILTAKDGTCYEVEDSASPIKGFAGNTEGAVIIFRDCSDKKEKQRKIAYLSMHDSLTGLYNRRYIESIEKTIECTANYPLTVMYADVNGLKLINDAFGHHAGDSLLVKVGKIIKKETKPNDIISRVGGDEFMAYLLNTDAEEAARILKTIQKAASKETYGGVGISVALGYAVKTSDAVSLEHCKKRAENFMYKNKMRYGKIMRSQTIETVLSSLNNKFDREQEHSERTAQLAELLSVKIGLSEKEVEDIKTAAVVHNIGKVVIPAEIMHRQGSLTDAEYEIVKQHAEVGYQMLKSVDEYASIAQIVLHHHEHWDGSGYPQGLKGESIPLGSRIISLCAAFEDKTVKSAESAPVCIEHVLEQIKEQSGVKFDPDLVLAFEKLFKADKFVF